MALTYVGNPDFRGYLNSLYKQGDQTAGLAINGGGNGSAGFVNNQGQIDQNQLQSYFDTPSGPSRQPEINKFQDYVRNAYNTFQQGTAPQRSSNTSGSSVDPNAIASYDQAIGNTNSAIGRLGAQLGSGNSAIDASYQNALNQLLLGKNQGEQAYKTTKQQTSTDYVNAKNTIGANTGQALNGLLRLLGSHGAGGGSAYLTSAPQAAARQATLQRTDVGNTFGANNQALDTNWNNYLTGYNNEVSGAGNQRDLQKQQLQQSVQNNRANLLQNLAQLSAQRAQAAGGNPSRAAQPYLDQANNILNQISSYTTAPINYQTQAYAAPDLAKYTFSNSTPTYQGQQQSNDYFSPYLSALLGKKQLATG